MRRTRHARSAIGAQLAAQHADRIGALLQGPVIPSLHGREAEPDRIGVGHSQLAARTERANRIGADLFPSIHHDDVQEIYHAKWTYDGAPHSYSDRFSGYSLFLSRENRHFDDSLAFAKLLGAALTECGLARSMPAPLGSRLIPFSQERCAAATSAGADDGHLPMGSPAALTFGVE
jgi:hypothetical protein